MSYFTVYIRNYGVQRDLDANSTMEMLVHGTTVDCPAVSAAPSISRSPLKSQLKHDHDASKPLRSLLDLACVAVATRVAVDEIAFHFDYFPAKVRQTLLHHMQDDRLRCLELTLACLTSPQHRSHEAFAVPAHETDFQHEWQRRCETQGYHVAPAISTDTLFRENDVTTRPRDARRVFWEHYFRNLVRSRPLVASTSLSGDPSTDKPQQVDIALYDGVVETLKLNARDLKPSSTSFILQLPLLKRLELHHLTDQHQSLELAVLEELVSKAPSLQKLCFFHGRLTAAMIQRISVALLARAKAKATHPLAPVKAVELISVKLKGQADHRHLVAFFERHTDLQSVRISSTISDFDNRRLVSVLMGLPKLESLLLEHNDLEDSAFADLSTPTTPLSLKYLRLGSNALSAQSMQTLTRLALDGCLPALERLELRGNQELGDAGIIALAPMLLSPDSRLSYLDLRNCHFGVEGALSLLSALDDNKTLRSLDLSQNFFGSNFGDVLADFLLTNNTLQRLHLNYVGLGHAGCTERLQLALRTNMSLRVFSVGANRLRDHGAALLLAAVASRSRAVAYEAVDLSGNLLTLDGVVAFKSILQGEKDLDPEETDESPPAKKRRRQSFEDAASSCRIGSLGLLNNDLVGRGDSTMRAEDAMRSLGRLVGKLYSNEWTTRRNVYDDEV